MAQVIVQMSCTKLKSVMIGNKFTGDLKGMVVVLEEVQLVLEAAERQSEPRGVAWYWLRRVRKTAYSIVDMVDELQAGSSASAAATVKTQIKAIKKELEEIQLESAIFKQPGDSRIPRAIHVPAEETTAAVDGAEQGAIMYVSPVALELRFRSLTPNLKFCFAYAAIFSKGHTIVKHDLIHQWIALHLIGEPSEEVSTAQRADEYITKLMDISFLQPAKSASTSAEDGKGTTLFTMPDNVHDFAISFMGDELVVPDATVGLGDINEYCRYALLTDLSNKLPAQLRALRCVGCSEMELSHDTFSLARCLRVLELKESSMQKLPNSICQLRHLGYLNLSGCSGLVTLPERFGDLINLFHVNLSGCCGLSKLPESFGSLKRLEHLDLSFSSCFQGIGGILGGFVDLQHLNLSNPCCYLPEHRSLLQKLNLVIRELTKLVYLNLSMFLNPIFCYMSEEQQRKYIGTCISGLSSLEHLDLSHNIFLRHLPENLGDLKKLHTLDLSGCIRIFPVMSIIKRAGMLNSVRLLTVRCRSLFVVRADDGAHNSSNLVQLEDVDSRELEIVCLEKIKSADEARGIRLADKGRLRMLSMHWTVGCHGAVEDSKDVLGELVPPHNLERLELHGYNSTCFPSWTLSISSHLPNLVEVTMEDIPSCSRLPRLGLLPKLRRLVLRRMNSIIRIDAVDLFSGDTEAFHQPSKFTIDDMESLQELNTTCDIDDNESMPPIDELVIRKCSKLSFGTLLPRARRLHISDCDQLMVTVLEECPPTPITELVVESCKVPNDDWSLLCHLDGLQKLSFFHCHSMTKLPKDLDGLLSLRELKIVSCKKLMNMPDSMRYLTSLQMLAIHGCPAIESLPESIHELSNLKDLDISECPKLANIQPLKTSNLESVVAKIARQDRQKPVGTDENEPSIKSPESRVAELASRARQTPVGTDENEPSIESLESELPELARETRPTNLTFKNLEREIAKAARQYREMAEREKQATNLSYPKLSSRNR